MFKFEPALQLTAAKAAADRGEECLQYQTEEQKALNTEEENSKQHDPSLYRFNPGLQRAAGCIE